jgi:hypothetical protein
VGDLAKFLVGAFVGFSISYFVMTLDFDFFLAGDDSEAKLLSSGVEVDQVGIGVVFSFLQFGQFHRSA